MAKTKPTTIRKAVIYFSLEYPKTFTIFIIVLTFVLIVALRMNISCDSKDKSFKFEIKNLDKEIIKRK